MKKKSFALGHKGKLAAALLSDFRPGEVKKCQKSERKKMKNFQKNRQKIFLSKVAQNGENCSNLKKNEKKEFLRVEIYQKWSKMTQNM